VRERTIEVDGVETWVRESPGKGTPVVFWHGNPTDADDWIPFMERLDRPSFAADMPAFGRSSAPDAFDCSVHSYGRWAEALLAELGIERYSLVIHDWGVIGLMPALAHPDRVESMVAFNSVPLGTSYRWHVLAREIWRRRPAGELANLLVRGPVIGLALSANRPGFRAMPRSMVDRVRRNFARPETRRAILALYRSADPEVIEDLGRELGRFTAPTLLLWAPKDPYIGAEYGRRLAKRLPHASYEELDHAGHWSWLDRPDAIDRAVGFLTGGSIDSAP
jgi:pimeloyl-ACP methyl ester carboxylesterase